MQMDDPQAGQIIYLHKQIFLRVIKLLSLVGGFFQLAIEFVTQMIGVLDANPNKADVFSELWRSEYLGSQDRSERLEFGHTLPIVPNEVFNELLLCVSWHLYVR